MNLKTLTVFAALAAVASVPAFADDPITFSDVSYQQDMSTRDLVVNYTLNGQPAIVRLDVQTNGTSIGRGHLKTFHASTDGYSATLTSPIAPGAHAIRWRARQDWPSNLVENLNVKLCALYPAEVSNILPTFYDSFSPRRVCQDFGNDWKFEVGQSYDGRDVFNIVRTDATNTEIQFRPIRYDGNFIDADKMKTDSYVESPDLGNLDCWRISFSVLAYIEEYAAAWEAWSYAGFSVRGFDENDEPVFRVNFMMMNGDKGCDFTCCGLWLQRNTYREFALVRDGTGQLTVFRDTSDGSYVKGNTSTIAINNPNAKLSKFRIYFLNRFATQNHFGIGWADETAGRISGRAHFKNIKIDDISASPF